MILVLDIGNSSAKAGLWDGLRVVRSARIAAEADLRSLLASAGAEAGTHACTGAGTGTGSGGITAAGAVSVVPGRNEMWTRLVHAVTGHSLTFFNAHSALPFAMRYETPDTLGADRVAAAVGAWHLAGRRPDQAAVVIDAGTAVNFEVVRGDGAYIGGIIAPGPELMRRSLNAGTAQLPLIPLVDPAGVTGASTEKALQSGVMNGFLSMTRGLLAGLLAEEASGAYVAATGGWAAWLADRLAGIDEVRPDLVLEGVAALVQDGVDP